MDKQQSKGIINWSKKNIADNYRRKELFLSKILAIVSIQSNTSLQPPVLGQPKQLVLVTSDSKKINKLRELTIPIELHMDGSRQALAAYADKKCWVSSVR